jgi:hypothetical protein
MGKRDKAIVEKAVKAMQLYLGSVDFAPVKVQQKFHFRSLELNHKVYTMLIGLGDKPTPTLVWEKIAEEARRRGIVRPSPGKDY